MSRNVTQVSQADQKCSKQRNVQNSFPYRKFLYWQDNPYTETPYTAVPRTSFAIYSLSFSHIEAPNLPLLVEKLQFLS